MVSKTLQLLSLLPRNPTEFCERIAAGIEARSVRSSHLDYPLSPPEKAITQLSKTLNADLSGKFREPELAEIETRVGRAKPQLLANAPFTTLHNGGSLLARLSYAVARVLRPQIVTGNAPKIGYLAHLPRSGLTTERRS